MMAGGYSASPEVLAEAIVAASRSMAGDWGKSEPEVGHTVRDILVDILGKGPVEDFMLLQLEFLEELPVAAIALLIDVPVAEARRMRAQALARLAGALTG
jgi:DNA-directed RNA polymerase specialized sigma24 family protein